MKKYYAQLRTNFWKPIPEKQVQVGRLVMLGLFICMALFFQSWLIVVPYGIVLLLQQLKLIKSPVYTLGGMLLSGFVFIGVLTFLALQTATREERVEMLRKVEIKMQERAKHS